MVRMVCWKLNFNDIKTLLVSFRYFSMATSRSVLITRLFYKELMYSDVRYSTFVRSLDSSVLESLAGCLDQVVVEFIVNMFVPVGFVPLSCILYWSPNLVNRTYSNVVGRTLLSVCYRPRYLANCLLGISWSEPIEAVHLPLCTLQIRKRM